MTIAEDRRMTLPERDEGTAVPAGERGILPPTSTFRRRPQRRGLRGERGSHPRVVGSDAAAGEDSASLSAGIP